MKTVFNFFFHGTQNGVLSNRLITRRSNYTVYASFLCTWHKWTISYPYSLLHIL